MSVKQRDEIHNLIIRKDNKQVYNLNLNNLGMPIVQFDGTYFYAMIGNQKDAEQVNSMLGNDPDQYDFSEGKSSNLVIFKFKINDNFLSTN